MAECDAPPEMKARHERDIANLSAFAEQVGPELAGLNKRLDRLQADLSDRLLREVTEISVTLRVVREDFAKLESKYDIVVKDVHAVEMGQQGLLQRLATVEAWKSEHDGRQQRKAEANEAKWWDLQSPLIKLAALALLAVVAGSSIVRDFITPDQPQVAYDSSRVDTAMLQALDKLDKKLDAHMGKAGVPAP